MHLLLRFRWLRRLVTVPAVYLAVVGLLTLSPVWVLVTAFASQFAPGRWRPLRLLWMFFLYLALEAVVLAALFLLWIADGIGIGRRSERSLDRHYRLGAWYLRRLLGAARRTFNLTTISEDDPLHPPDPDRPVLVFSRHAGAGDSMLLVDAMLNGVPRRRPRVVLKAQLQLDPVVDVLLNRVGAAFVGAPGGGRDEVIAAIVRLAGTATARDALLLFPEGGNFTSGRRRKAIRALRSVGRHDLATRAETLRNLLPPKPLGVSTAIDAAPEATVVFVGHVGLERLSSPGEIWRYMPMDNIVRTRVWRVPAEEVPPPGAEREHWLYDHWREIDDWIDEHLPETMPAIVADPPAPAPPVPPLPPVT